MNIQPNRTWLLIILTGREEKLVYWDEPYSATLMAPELLSSSMRRTASLFGMVILFSVLLACSAGCVSEPPVPGDGTYFITIDSMPDQILGTAFVISGTTNLPSGSKLLYEQVWDDWRNRSGYGAPRYPPEGAGFISAVIDVQIGNGTVNTWEMPIDSSSYLYPKTYLVWVDSLDLKYSAPRSVAPYNLTRPDGSMITQVPTPTPYPYRLSIDPVPDQIPGSVFTISGTTTLPVESLIYLEHHRAVNPHMPPDAGAFSETVLVSAGSGTENVWQYTIDSSGFPDRLSYIIGVRAQNASPAGTSYFLIHPEDTPIQFLPIPTHD